jgi:hypothetical protein
MVLYSSSHFLIEGLSCGDKEPFAFKRLSNLLCTPTLSTPSTAQDKDNLTCPIDSVVFCRVCSAHPPPNRTSFEPPASSTNIRSPEPLRTESSVAKAILDPFQDGFPDRLTDQRTD